MGWVESLSAKRLSRLKVRSRFRLAGGFSRCAVCVLVAMGVLLVAPSVSYAAPGDPEIDVWEGLSQEYGTIGVPQKLYNILGRVSDDTFVDTLSYTINDGPDIPLSIGPDTFRLQNDGDFNIDINRNNLNAGINLIDITAEDSQGNTTTVTVSLNYMPENTWPIPYTINWDTVSELTDVVQIVDGLWDLDSNGARVLEWGYDRILAVGDIGWTDYEVTVPITVYDHDELDLGFPSIGPGIGIVMRWQGHSDWQGRQPNIGYLPMGASFWYDFSLNNGTFGLHGDFGSIQYDQTGRKLDLGTTYFWKFRCEGQQDGSTFYAGKIWEQGEPEPPGWFLSGFEGFNDLPNGCVLLIPHHVDARFGDVSVVPLGAGSTLAISNLQVIPSQTSAQVLWSTNQLADGTVAYGTTAGYELGTEVDPAFVSTHNITLNNLNPNTLYHIQVTSENASEQSASSGDFTFTTLGPRTITTSTSGDGSIVLTPDQPNYLDNDVVGVEAVPDPGWMFVNWQGDLSGNTNPTQLTVSGDMNVTAVFTDNIDTNGPVISNVQVTAGATSAQVTWTTDELANSSVAHGPTAAYENGSVSNQSEVINHTINLPNLTPETTYHYQITSEDMFANSSQTVDAVFMTTAGVTSGLVSDDFSTGVLDTGVWTFVNPTGNSSFNMTGTQVEIFVEAGVLHSMYWGGDRLSPRIMQNVQDADFQMEVSFESLVTEQFQTQGIVAEQDASNYVYFDIFSNGGEMLIYVESVIGGAGTSHVFATIGPPGPSKARLDRTGDVWTFEYSTDDGQNWITGASFSTALNLTAVGVYAGNDSFSGIDSPAHTAVIDYVFNMASPIDPEDGGDVCAGVDCSGLDTDCTIGVCNPSTGICESQSANNGSFCSDGDPCTVNDICSDGSCVGTAKNCTGLNSECTVGVCNAITGDCEAEPANENGQCDDGDLCTVTDFCSNGVCGGLPADCSGFDSDCTVGTCNPSNGLCEISATNEGQACSDGDLCSTGDACSNGLCLGDAVDCSGLDSDCTVGACNAVSGICEAVPINEGGACDDGDNCTTGDLCSNGVCGAVAVDCSGLDDDCVVGVCNPVSGICETAPANEGGACDDGVNCTTGDACSNGICLADAIDCSGLDDACNVGVCNEGSGTCETAPANESGTCDDLDPCTVNDACTNGTCAGAPKDCSALDGPCTVGVCNGSTGECEALPTNEGLGCDDGDLCTSGDVCVAGVCEGAEVDCSSLDDECLAGACNPSTGACEAVAVNEGGSCDDGDLCTTTDACTNGVCAGAPVDCSGLDDTCVVGACNPSTGSCETLPANEGGTCDDGDNCTINDACTNGICEAEPLDCSGLDDACNIGTCNETLGTCEATPFNEGGTCDDFDPCTENDTCAGGTCAGTPKDCSGLDSACAVGVCNETTGACEAEPINEGNTCDDGDLCTVLDACTNGVCAGVTQDCSGLTDDCNVGVCNPGNGACEAQPANEGGGCDDGDLCTTVDACTNGVCAGSAIDCSSLDDQCLQGACNPTTGQCEAVAANEGASCSDGDLCTTSDICTNGICEGAFVDCSGLDDACNVGVCASSSGFCEQVAVNEGGGCDDGDLCTESDTCGGGVCQGTLVDCSELDGMCQTGVCDGGTGNCVAQLAENGTSCDDDDLCTNEDECFNGACEGIAVDCSELDDACNVGSCNASTGQCEAAPANEGQPCDDAIECTFDEACASGECVGTLEDCDGDGECDGDDNCPLVANPLQEDADFDGFGDACDEMFDFDHDGDVDVDDLGEFAACISGAGFDATLSCQETFDSDADGDIDLFDWAVFQTSFTGPTAITCP